MHESSFIPTYDDFFKKTLVPEYQKATGIDVDYQLISVGSLQTRMATAAETGNGPDMTCIYFNWPFLFDEKLVDVSDIAEAIGKKNGGWYDFIKEAVVVNGKWKAIPFGNVGQIMNWRTDWFAEVGVKDFPDTWDELLEAGIKLKKAGHPFGFELGHGFGDNHGWLYPLLWSYGAREVEPDGKTVVIDSDETARAVDFCRKFFQRPMLEDCLGWTDVSNNKAWMSEQISCTNNAESILWFAKKQFPDIAKVTAAVAEPAGAEGALPHPRAVEPLDLQLLAEPAGGEGLPGLADGSRSRSSAGMPRPTATTRRSCTPMTMRRSGTSSRATCRIAIRSRPRICLAGRRRSAGRSRRAWRNTSWWTCSPRPAPASPPRR